MRQATTHHSDCRWCPSAPIWFEEPPPPRAWLVDAACRGQGALFFSDLRIGHPDRRRWIKEAKTICQTCPVIAECLDEVLAIRADDDVAGVCAGYTVPERQQLRRDLARR